MGLDYAAFSTLLTFDLPGEICVSVTLEEDADLEISERFRINLIAAPNIDGIILSLNVTVVTVLDQVNRNLHY